ncbi:MAG TPA: acyltransferase [Pseudolysinimonas sp.]
MSIPRGADAVPSIDLSKRDLTLDLARVFCVLLVVVIHLLEVGVGTGHHGLTITRPLEHQPWFNGITWVFQIMPLFFVVGGFASLTAWRSLGRRGGGAADYVKTRVLRLAQPAFPLFVFYVVVVGIATLIGIDPELLGPVVLGAGSPLWFLAAYGLCQAMVPFAAHWHARSPKLTLLVLLLGAIVVDAARYSSGIDAFGLLNLFFVWVLIQQFGFWYADGWFDRRAWWQLLLIALASWATLFPMVIWGPYSPDMLTNLNPPTVPLIALGLSQACVLRLLRPALAALMRTRGARTAVFLVGSRLMTIYLWHLPIIIILAGVALLVPGASPEPGSAAWWWSRIPVYLIVLALLFALSLLVGRWEQPREVGPTPPAAVVAIASVLTIVPPALIIEFFLDLKLSILSAVCFGAAILLLGRWPRPKEAPAAPGPETASKTATA